MFCQASFDQWLTTIMQPLSPLSKPQATGLALWSLGMVLARSCALTTVSGLLAAGMKRKEQSVRQQLREWYYDVLHKRGDRLDGSELVCPMAVWAYYTLGLAPVFVHQYRWHPSPVGTPCFRLLQSFVPQPGRRWRGRGTAFQKAGRQVEGARCWPCGRRAIRTPG